MHALYLSKDWYLKIVHCLHRFSMCKLRFFFYAKRSSDNLQDMIGRHFKFYFHYLALIRQHSLSTQYIVKHEWQLSEKCNECKLVDFIASLPGQMHVDPHPSPADILFLVLKYFPANHWYSKSTSRHW